MLTKRDRKRILDRALFYAVVFCTTYTDCSTRPTWNCLFWIFYLLWSFYTNVAIRWLVPGSASLRSPGS